MNYLIIEDEEQASKKLIRMIKELVPNAFIHGPLESVADSVNWLKSNPPVDLIFLDIHLADGLSFEIFEQITTGSPIVFTTAYDQYALKAFKLNSIDYLLKPIEKESLEIALDKFQKRTSKKNDSTGNASWAHLIKEDYQQDFKKRFISKIGDKLEIIEVSNSLFFYSENKGTYLRTKENRTYLIDFSLEDVESVLNPDEFFRLNRKYIVRLDAVQTVRAYSNGRVKVYLSEWDDQDIVLSREKTKAFKAWVDK